MQFFTAVLDWAIRSMTQHYERLDFDSDVQAPLIPKAVPSLRRVASITAK